MRQAWVWLLLLFLVTDARFQPTSYDYDEAGWQTTQTDALGRVTRYAHADPVNGTDPSGHFTLTELSVSMGNAISNYGQRAYSAYNVYSRVTDAIDLAKGIYWCFGLAATIYYDATSSAGLAPGDSDSLEMLSSEASPQVMTAGIGGNSATATFLAGSTIYALWQRAASNLHHIATNKHGIWTPDFKRIFDRAGLSLNDAANLVSVKGHGGPHPEEYHRIIYERLTQAVKGHRPGSPAMKKAFITELKVIGRKRVTPGDPLNKLILKRVFR